MRYHNGSFYDDGIRSEIINGILLCDSCERWYPIEDRVLVFLPDNLIGEDRSNFKSKYGNDFLINKERIETTRDRQYEDSLKVREIRQRDEEANIYHTFGSDFHDGTERGHFLRIIKPENKDVIVELGCGTGRITRDFADRVVDYIAIDFSGKSLELAKKEVRADVLLVKGDVCNLPVKDRVASQVISAQVFEHIPGDREQQKFVSEVQRVLKKNGQAVLTVYNYSIEKRLKFGFQKTGLHADEIYYDCFTRKQLLRHFQKHFEILELRGINCFLPKLSRLKSLPIRGLIESTLSRTFLNAFLGQLWLLSLKKTSIVESSNYI